MQKPALPEALRTLVRVTVGILGQIIERELGREAYLRIESIRKRMVIARTGSTAGITAELNRVYRVLESCKSQDRLDIANAYTLMLELMNTCENAYRTHRLKQVGVTPLEVKEPTPITYVLTAHPTESRSSKNIQIFHEIQQFLVNTLDRRATLDEAGLKSLIEIAWRVPIVRSRKPTVEDEADHLYSIALREDNLQTILRLNHQGIPIFLRSWVGGDKDGHPGVNEVTLQNSLQASRTELYRHARRQLDTLADLLELFPSRKIQFARMSVRRALSRVYELSTGDGRRIKILHQKVLDLKSVYQREVGEAPDALKVLEQLLRTFPALVIPLELREDSGLILEAESLTHRSHKKKYAIERMLKQVAAIAKGGNPRWYAQGFIISMCHKIEHIEAAANLLSRTLGGLKIRVIPLFEQKEALQSGPEIIDELLSRKRFQSALKQYWLNRVEIMLGYSDSSKENGAFSSRLEVSRAMGRLDKICKKHGVQPIYFHGSGGSVDRGGGPIEDQLASWSKGALAFYKATIQGEMVERSFASAEIAESQFLKIAATAQKLRRNGKSSVMDPALQDFALKVEHEYRSSVGSPRFMAMVETATPYRFLSALKMGSRPTKRASSVKGSLAVTSLRAIPWVLCWTQTRVLFPTWWGLGTAWSRSTSVEKLAIRKCFKSDPLFRSFIHVLGFTLAKIELAVFHFYLDRSALAATEKKYFKNLFEDELKLTLKFFKELTGRADPLWFRPWLAESINLRSAMIHPLNLLQILAQKDQDLPLLRVAVTGVASGMLTTG